jgi:hypothetical protein
LEAEAVTYSSVWDIPRKTHRVVVQDSHGGEQEHRAGREHEARVETGGGDKNHQLPGSREEPFSGDLLMWSIPKAP